MSYLVEIDEGACVAHGDCAEIAPEIFELGEVAQVIGTGPDEVLVAVAEACPSTAIRIIDAQTSALVYP